ncbi:MAG: DUF3084 domain-containing protein [Candidatus Eremiobacteraeota bacterium]|nr:DUF3084 domain-containing protein [Candidatus Eremiobacteraeota bacterium]MBV9647952.1 DUF3084 domain-containing protein [Candidatus Eremiobacteraeota bacterium]
MGYLGGALVVIVIAILAGTIAYVGDRVGHQVGRRRLTLFGLRPKYTSTVVAVGTGMVIALAVTIITLAASNYARAAFFHLSEINDRLNELQAQADALDRRVHQTHVIVNRGDLLYNPYLLLQPSATGQERLRQFSAYFNAAVSDINRNLVPRGLKPYPLRANDPEVQRRLKGFLDDPEMQSYILQGPVLIITIADENLFNNDPIHFDFASYRDQMIFQAHQPIASVEVDGGTQINPQIAFSEVLFAAADEAQQKGMPAPYVRNAFPSLTPRQVEDISNTIRRGHGRYRILARAKIDIYPHTGGLPVDFDLVRAS